MEHLGWRVRIEDVEISDRGRDYGRAYAGRVGEIQEVSHEPSPPGAMASGRISMYEVRLDESAPPRYHSPCWPGRESGGGSGPRRP